MSEGLAVAEEPASAWRLGNGRDRIELVAFDHWRAIQTRKRPTCIFRRDGEFKRVHRDCARAQVWLNDERFELVGVYTQAITYEDLLADLRAITEETET